MKTFGSLHIDEGASVVRLSLADLPSGVYRLHISSASNGSLSESVVLVR